MGSIFLFANKICRQSAEDYTSIVNYSPPNAI